MRRADPSTVVSDIEGAPMPAYADSDVSSSPRSTGGATGGRAGFLAEEPPPPFKWDNAAFVRVKLMCSYGGRILPRPHDNQLRYVGGESRIAVVNRSITFSEITSKLSRMFGSSVTIKYQLPYEDLDALISVTSDEDLENMMEEYDRLQILGNQVAGSRQAASARLRLFLFSSKIERSQTASLSEMMENNHSHERMFVDILNGAPVMSRVRSETSSIVSETPHYYFQGNMDALEEWAAAASYGNSVPSSGEQLTDNKQGSLDSPTLVTLNEAVLAPGSPSPSKAKATTVGSSSPAPLAFIPGLSAVANAASKGLPTFQAQVDESMGSFVSKNRLGSGDSIGSIPEQRKHVDSELLLASDKSILSSSVGGVEQLLPAGLMDDDDSSQKYLSKRSFHEISDSSETVVFDAGPYQEVSEPSKAFKGGLVSDNTASMGQPIFDDEMSSIARNLNVLQLDRGTPPPHILSPSSTSSASAQLVPPASAPQQVTRADEKLKYHEQPVSPSARVHLGNEDKVMQQILPPSVLNMKSAPIDDLHDGLSRQVSPTLAHFLPSHIVPQHPPNSTGDTLMPQGFGVNTTRDVETAHKIQVVTNAIPSVTSPSMLPPTVHKQKAPTVPVSGYLYQQSPVHGLEVPISRVISRPQSPPVVASELAPPVIPHVRTPSPPPVVTSMLVSNFSQPEALRGQTHVPNNVVLPNIKNIAEGVRGNPYQQGEVVNNQRPVGDPMYDQRLGFMNPQLASQFNVATLSAPPAPGMPTHFRAVGLPLQQVVEGVPLQHAPLVGVNSDNNAPAPMQRAGKNPVARPPSASSGQYAYPSPILQSSAVGGGIRYNVPSNIIGGVPGSSPDTPPFAGANPFVDSL